MNPKDEKTARAIKTFISTNLTSEGEQVNAAREALKRAVANGKPIDWDVIAPPSPSMNAADLDKGATMSSQRNAIAKAYLAGTITTDQMLDAVQNPVAIAKLSQAVVVRTAKLSNGLRVLARDSGPYVGTPKTFANLTQAKRWVDALTQSGQGASIYRLGRPFYVVLEGEGQS